MPRLRHRMQKLKRQQLPHASGLQSVKAQREIIVEKIGLARSVGKKLEDPNDSIDDKQHNGRRPLDSHRTPPHILTVFNHG